MPRAFVAARRSELITIAPTHAKAIWRPRSYVDSGSSVRSTCGPPTTAGVARTRHLAHNCAG